MRSVKHVVGVLILVAVVAGCRAPGAPAEASASPDVDGAPTAPASAPPIPSPDASGKPTGPSPSIEIPPPVY
jgi:hypothetical protein